MGIIIRDFAPKDIERILDYREESARVSFPDLMLDREKAKGFLLEHAEKHPGTIRVAELGGRLVGFVRFLPEKGSFGDYGILDLIFVEEDFRKMGAGKALLQAAEEWFAARGISRIEAVVTKTNAASLGFFKSNGYEEKRAVLQKKL